MASITFYLYLPLNTRIMALIEIDFKQDSHRLSFVRLLGDYMADDMGGNLILPLEQAEKVIVDLSDMPHYKGFLFEFNGEFSGLANCFEVYSTFRAKRILNIHDFVTGSEFRGKGLARYFLNEIISYAKQQGYCRISLEVRTDNVKAKNLYRTLGFQPCNPEMLFWQREL